MSTLKNIVLDICARANVPASRVDVTALPDVDVDGFIISAQYPAGQAIQALGQIYRFDPVSYDNKIRFVPRGANAVATVTEDDMVDDEEDIEEHKRMDSIEIPRVLHLNYHDSDGNGLSPRKQSSERAEDRRAVGEASIQSSVLMSTDLAAQSVAIIHKVMAEDQKGELRFSLSDKFLRLTATDNIILQWNGKSERVRLQQVDIAEGLQKYACLRDRQSAEVSTIEGIPAPVVVTPPSQAPGPTLVVPLDIPLLRDVDDAAGLALYVAVTGFTAAWAGALVEMSRDGGANFLDSDAASYLSVIGELVLDLPDHPAAYPDETNTLMVRLYHPSGELIDSDLAGMLNGANLAAIGSVEYGWELINFADVAELDPQDRIWSIENMLRGRKHTQTQAHLTGALFVLLDRGLLGFEPLSLTDLGRELTFRATTSGDTTSTVNTDLTFEGHTQVEYPVSYLAAERDGDDVIVTWQGTPRLGSGSSVAHGANFAGYRVTFSDGVDEIEVSTVATTATQDVSTLMTPITVSVVQLNSLTGAGPSQEVTV